MAVISASAVALHLKGYVYMAQCSAHRIFLLAIPEEVQSGTGTQAQPHIYAYICSPGVITSAENQHVVAWAVLA